MAVNGDTVRSGDKRRVGIVGYGSVGEYLSNAIQNHTSLKLAFVWNRSLEKLKGKIPDELVLCDLQKAGEKKPDIIVEVAHPKITEQYGESFLEIADYMVGSPTAFADEKCEMRLRTKANSGPHGLYVPAGAFWGGEDVRKMADRGTLKGLKVTMRKHPKSFKLSGDLAERNKKLVDGSVVLYDGPVRQLCPLAPNNVNTMAAASIAAWNLGFDGVQGCLVADTSLDCHIVEIDVKGPGEPGNEFSVQTIRRNPAATGAVTGSATYASFLSSLLGAHGKGPGVHLC